MRLGNRLADLAERVAEELERPPGGDLGIELAQRAGGGVARIGEDRLAPGLARLVHREEGRLLHIDLAAYLHRRGSAALQTLRQPRDRAQGFRDFLGLGAVAARGAADE